ncbi:hypothetical protein D0T84_21720 [Dysgonomonas sp. 521]|uniref:hypothetical protein n=1 Tax=Dysgonomonas sp. 521 TaxID=2302932 RepID=UPI0013D60358|nr:hypothetical protein [Dysgonomonas sp. 521]NDV97489.1 hypothetical protein [Dysgonomonas sp. 521]
MTKLIRTLILFLSFVIFSCSSDSDNNGDITSKTYKVRYEASCDNPNTTLRILYTTKNADIEHISEDAKEVFVKSPFSTELEMQYGDYCYISVYANGDDRETISDELTFTSSIFVDGIKKAETSNKTVSVSYYILTD